MILIHDKYDEFEVELLLSVNSLLILFTWPLTKNNSIQMMYPIFVVLSFFISL